VSWDPNSLPGQPDKTFVVTGGSSGIGYFIVEQLAATGARVVVASRSRERAALAAESVRREVPNARLGFIELDLGSLESVRRAAEAVLELGSVDGLVENAGLTDSPRVRATTTDGLELLVGTNFVGHFALTALAFPALSGNARVVSMGSMSTRLSKANPADLLSEKKYSASAAYATSKHLTQTFGFELDRRLRAAGSDIESIVAHPGFALDVTAPGRPGINDLGVAAIIGQSLLRPMSQGRDRGAWPVVRALLDPGAKGGEFYGPSRSVAGRPIVIRAVDQDYDPAFGASVWEHGQAWSGVDFTIRSS
jgi:NAD(P)-dependent dehydrogenase (short-subunit alcohol dehydrogenase family)